MRQSHEDSTLRVSGIPSTGSSIELNSSTLRALLFRLVPVALALVLAGRAAALQPFPPDGTKIVDVVIEGTRNTDESRIVSVMELKTGQTFRRDAQRRDMQAIADLGFYNPLTISMTTEDSGDGVVLKVRVDENPTIGRITILGNVKFTGERLRRELDFKEGDILPLSAKSRTTANLRSFYANGGYKSTIVRVSVEAAAEDGKVDVSILIDEGEKIKIRDLKVSGNKHFSDFRIGTSVLNSGSWLFFRNYYDDEAFDDDLRTVEAMYRDAGYLDATARRGEFEYDSDKAEVIPEIVVTEGPRYRIEAVETAGNFLITDAEIAECFKGMLGRHFDGRRFGAAMREAYHLYGEQGYADARIESDFVKDPATGRASVRLEIVENDIVYVGRIVVKKNTYDYEVDLNALERFVDWTSPGVKSEAILDEVTLEPGERYDTREEERTIRRLRNLGIFKKVEIERQPTADPQVTDVVVDVEQDPNAGYIAVTAGIGEVSGFAVGVNYVNPDLFGEARVLKAGATVGSRVVSFNIGYLDRHFRDSDNSLELSLYHDRIRYPEIEQRVTGGSVEYGIPLSEFNTLLIRPRTEYVDLDGDEDDLKEDLGSYIVGAVRTMVVRDLRNDRKWTTRGYVASGGVEIGGARQFMTKFLTDFDWYTALDDPEDWVYRFRNTFAVQPYDSDHVGFTERFFLGGRTSLRGFAVHGAGDVDEHDSDLFTGGSTLWTQSHELRHRFTNFLAGRVFVDGGMLNDEAMEFGHIRASTGVGASFDVGAFVVDVDAGFPIASEKHDETQIFSFSIRSNF